MFYLFVGYFEWCQVIRLHHCFEPSQDTTPAIRDGNGSGNQFKPVRFWFGFGLVSDFEPDRLNQFEIRTG